MSDRRQSWGRVLVVVGLLVGLLTPAVMVADAADGMTAAPEASMADAPIAYPDLISITPPEDMYIGRPTPTTKEFNYEHLVFNAGDGPLELQPTGYDSSTGYAAAAQRLYRYDAAGVPTLVQQRDVRDRLYFHTVHGHFHFPLASFGLYAVTNSGGVGEPVALSPKNGFCIADSQVVDPTVVHAPDHGAYDGGTCVDPTALRGIAPGWADLYDRRDPGQAIDITGLPDGVYWFQASVDPGNNFVEADKTNNNTSIKVQISGDTVKPVSPLVQQGSFLIDKSFLDHGVGDGDTPAFSTTYADDLLVAFVGASGPAGTKQTATVSGGGLTWKLASRSNAQTGTSEVWTARATGKLTNAVITSKLASPAHAQAFVVYALKGAAGIGATAISNGATGAPSVGLTTTKNGSWVMGVGNDPDRWIPRTPASGQTLVHQVLGEYFGTGTQWVQAPFSPTPAAGTRVTLADSYPTRDRWNFASVEIVPERGTDTTPPTMTAAQARDIGPDRATVAWTTNEPASTRVRYGTTSEYGLTSAVDPALVLQHEQDLTGLTPSTRYFCQLESTDVSGNTALRVGPTFETTAPRTTPPVFSNVRLTDLQPDAATFAWTTDEPADSQVEVGTTTGYGTSSPRSPALVESHFVTLNSLAPNTTYHYRVRSTDAYGNAGASSDLTFTTPGIPPPIVVDRTVSVDGGDAVSTPPISTAQPGELLAAFVSADGGAGQSSSVSGGGLTWQLAARSNGTAGTSEVWTAVATQRTAGAVVTSTLAQRGYDQSLSVVAYQGAVGVGDVGTTSGTTGAAGVRVKTIRTGSLVYGVGNDSSRATARTVGTGQTKVHEWVDSGAGNTFWVQRRSADAGPVESIVDLGTTAPTSTSFNLVGVEIVRPLSVPPATGPVVTAVSTSDVAATSATVRWETDRPSSSKVEFGPTTTYGSSTTTDPTGVLHHSQALTGLTPGTTYHYRVTSSTVNGTTTAPDATFTTLPAPPTGTPAIDTSRTANGRSTTTTPGITTQASNALLLAFVATDGPATGGQSTAVTGGGLTWTLVRRVATQLGVSEVWKARAPGVLTGATVTARAARTGYDQALTVVAFKDGRGGTSAGASAPSGAPTVRLTTTADRSLVLGVGNDWDGATPRTLPAGRSMVSQWVDTAAGDTFWVQRRTAAVTLAGTLVTTSATAPTNHRWNMVAVEVKPL